MTWFFRRKSEGVRTLNLAFSKELYLPLLVCVLGALGSWAGVMMSAKYSTSAYQYQKRFEWEAKIFDRRVDTIERMARLMARQPGLQDEWSRYLDSLKSNKLNLIPARESSLKLEEYNAEYVNVLMLASLYFGPETGKAVVELEKDKSPWWMKSFEKQRAVTDAMIKELSSTLPTFNSTLKAGKI